MRRPLLLPAGLFTAGIVADEFLGGRWEWLLAAVALTLGCAVVSPAKRVVALAAGLFITGWLNYAVHQSAYRPHDLRRLVGTNAELVTLRGEIAETPALRLTERQGQ
jgi:hypothetical protein